MERWEKRLAFGMFGLIMLGMMCGCVKKTIVEHKADSRVERLQRENDFLKRQLEIDRGIRK